MQDVQASAWYTYEADQDEYSQDRREYRQQVMRQDAVGPAQDMDLLEQDVDEKPDHTADCHVCGLTIRADDVVIDEDVAHRCSQEGNADGDEVTEIETQRTGTRERCRGFLGRCRGLLEHCICLLGCWTALLCHCIVIGKRH